MKQRIHVMRRRITDEDHDSLSKLGIGVTVGPITATPLEPKPRTPRPTGADRLRRFQLAQRRRGPAWSYFGWPSGTNRIRTTKGIAKLIVQVGEWWAQERMFRIRLVEVDFDRALQRGDLVLVQQQQDDTWSYKPFIYLVRDIAISGSLRVSVPEWGGSLSVSRQLSRITPNDIRYDKVVLIGVVRNPECLKTAKEITRLSANDIVNQIRDEADDEE